MAVGLHRRLAHPAAGWRGWTRRGLAHHHAKVWRQVHQCEVVWSLPCGQGRRLALIIMLRYDNDMFCRHELDPW